MVSSSTRGGAAEPVDPDDKLLKRSEEALSSIRSCYRASFISVAVDLVVTLLDMDVYRSKKITWIEIVDLADSLNILYFGIGLLRVTRIYANAKEERLTLDSVFDLVQTMAGIWRTSAWIIVALSMTKAAPLSKYIGCPALSYVGPAGVAAVAMAGTVGLRIECAKRAAELVKAEKTHPGRERNRRERADFDKTRRMGFLATRNMSFCMGSFALMGLVHFVIALAKPASWVEFGMGLVDVVEHMTIAKLLATLSQSFLRAVVDVTGSIGSKSDVDQDLYIGLYEAQKGFYGKIAGTLNFAAALTALPYLIAGAKTLVKPFI